MAQFVSGEDLFRSDARGPPVFTQFLILGFLFFPTLKLRLSLLSFLSLSISPFLSIFLFLSLSLLLFLSMYFSLSGIPLKTFCSDTHHKISLYKKNEVFAFLRHPRIEREKKKKGEEAINAQKLQTSLARFFFLFCLEHKKRNSRSDP